MPKSWSEVENSEDYINLSPQAKIQAKGEYWEKVVSTKKDYTALDKESQAQAKYQFFGGRQEGDLPMGGREMGDRSLIGNIFERPGAAVRSAIQGKGYIEGANVPENVPTFLELSQKEPVAYSRLVSEPGVDPVSKTIGMADMVGRGVIKDALGMAADIATNPADVLSMVLGKAPVGPKKMYPSTGITGRSRNTLGEVVERTRPMQEVGKFLDKERYLPKFDKNPKTRIDKIIDISIDKSIRPSVSGKGTAKLIEGSREKARDAVKTIVENKDILQFTDEQGNIVNRLPESLDDFSQAIAQTKSHIYNVYDSLIRESGESGAKVQTAPIIKELKSVSSSKTLRIANPEAAKYADELIERLSANPELGVREADDLIQIYNNKLKAFYKAPTYDVANQATIDAMVANRLRGALDDTITGLTGKNFQLLKNRYGALKSIEKEVNQRLIVDARKNIKGLVDFTDVFSGGQIINGIVNLNPGQFASGVAQKLIAKAIKETNNPNRIIKQMFQNVGKNYVPEAPGINPEVLRDLILTDPSGKRSLGYAPLGRIAVQESKKLPYTPKYLQERAVSEVEKPFTNVKEPAPLGSDKPIQSGMAEEYSQYLGPKEAKKYLEGGSSRLKNTKGSANIGEKSIFTNQAKKQFGLTNDINEAGYITKDGDLLDFTGRHHAVGYENSKPKIGQPDYLKGTRNEDHREIGSIVGEYDEKGIEKFLAEGNIRIDANSGGIQIGNVKPNNSQLSHIKDIAEMNNGAIVIDIGSGKNSFHMSYDEGTKTSKIIKDINTFFSGRVPDKYLGIVGPMATASAGIATGAAVGNANAGERIDISKINMIESSGNEKAIGDNGKAFGINQIHIGTLNDFNAKNKKNYTKEDLMNKAKNNEVADWYYNKEIPRMLKAYKISDNSKNRIIAYNWGIGHLVRWHKDGAKEDKLPKTTRDYISKYSR